MEATLITGLILLGVSTILAVNGYVIKSLKNKAEDADKTYKEGVENRFKSQEESVNRRFAERVMAEKEVLEAVTKVNTDVQSLKSEINHINMQILTKLAEIDSTLQVIKLQMEDRITGKQCLANHYELLKEVDDRIRK